MQLVPVVNLQVVIPPFHCAAAHRARIVQLVVVFGFAGGCSGSAGGFPTLPFCSSAPGHALQLVQLVVVFGFAGGYPTLPFCSSAPGQALQLVAVLDLQVVIPPYLQQRTWARSAAGGCCDSAGGYPTFSFCSSARWQLAGARLLLHARFWPASAVARLGLCRPAGGLDEQL